MEQELTKRIEALKLEVEQLEAKAEALKSLERFGEAELNKLCSQASAHYMKKHYLNIDLPLDERMKILNAVAHGCYMGFRKKEEMLRG